MRTITKLSGILSVLTFSIVTSYAGIEVPRTVRTIEELDQVRAEAREEGKALAFVLTDTKTSCGLCIGATKEAFDELGRYAIPVLLDVQNAVFYEHISPVVGGSLNADKMGNFIPKAVVSSDDMMQVLGSIPYKSMSSARNFSELNKRVKAALEAAQQGGNVETQSVVPVWYSTGTKGRFFEGNFKEVTTNKKGAKQVVLAQKNGKEIRVGFNLLTPAAVDYIGTLQGTLGSKTTEDSAAKSNADTVHSWESANGGKSIEGKFISLSNGKITIEKEVGGTITFDVSLLSDKSKKHARALAAER